MKGFNFLRKKSGLEIEGSVKVLYEDNRSEEAMVGGKGKIFLGIHSLRIVNEKGLSTLFPYAQIRKIEFREKKNA